MALRRQLIAASLAAGLWALPAAACPACAGRDDSPNRTRFFIGAMVLLPWTVSAAVIFALRRLKDEPSITSEFDHGDPNEP